MSALNKIMYVDDDPDMLHIVALGLKMGHFTVEVCNSGHDALQQVTSFQPDLVMLDMLMPGMTGTDTLRELHKVPGFEALPAIFLTAKVNKQQLETYKNLGAIGVINKPLNPLKLAGVVRELWDKRMSRT